MQEYIVEKNGRRRKAVRVNCGVCDNSFLARPIWIKNGRGKYCSQACSSKARIRRVELVCALCEKRFFRHPSKLASSVHKIYFCSRSCKDKAQSLDGGVKDIQPSHYGNGVSCYRDIALRNLEQKCKCGFSFLGLLAVHHRDGDRKNNDLSNLEMVCPTCHNIRHMTMTKRGWAMSWASLTPLEVVSEIEKKILAGL